MTRGVALSLLLALCCLPAASAELDGGAVLALAELEPAAAIGADPSFALAEAAAPSGACVQANSPGAQRSSDAPVIVDTTPDHDKSTGADVDGNADQGMQAEVCVIPCSPIMPMPPYYRPTCTDAWVEYVCGNPCATAIDPFKDLVCASCQTLVA